MPRKAVVLGLSILALVAGITGLALRQSAGEPDRTIGLNTSLPILWGESDSIAAELSGEAKPHWALAVLQAELGRLRPLDTLDAIPRDINLLVLAQPRPFAPQENVALDAWVRSGGHVLLFADPMLTGESAFALGDRRRPQDVVLISPILARWGLELQFDDEDQFTEYAFGKGPEDFPVNMPGRLVPLTSASSCRIEREGLIAQCPVGKGRVLVVADAALLETGSTEDREQRQAALQRLIDTAAH